MNEDDGPGDDDENHNDGAADPGELFKRGPIAPENHPKHRKEAPDQADGAFS